MEPADVEYKKIAGYADTKGQAFEAKMAALFFLRGVNSGGSFQLGSNVDGAGALDDVVFRFKPRGGQAWTTCFVQLKHKKSAWVTRRALTGGKDFGLRKYFDSYLDIKLAMSADNSKPFFDGSIDDCTIVLFTNAKASSDLGEGRPVEGVVEEFLGSSSGGVYSFDPDGDREVDKEIFGMLADAEDDARDFLKRLRVFCGQPNEGGFDAVIKDELLKINNNVIKKISIDRLCECFVENVSDWCEKSNLVITENSSLLLDALDRVVLETCAAQDRGTEILDVAFSEAALSSLKSGLSGDFALLRVESSESSCRLSATKLLQAFDGSHLFLGITALLENKHAVLSQWRSGKLSWLAISTKDRKAVSISTFVGFIREVCSEAFNANSRVVIISSCDVELADGLANEFGDEIKTIEDLIEFSQLNSESQSKILGKEISFQGIPTKLSAMLADDHEKADQMLDARSLINFLSRDVSLSAGSVLADEISYYVPRTLERTLMVKESIFTVPTLKAGVTLVHSTRQDVKSVIRQSKVFMKSQSVDETLDKFSTPPPRPSKEDGNVSVGETFQLGAYECQHLFLWNEEGDSVAALRIRVRVSEADTATQGPLSCWFLFVTMGTREEDVSILSAFNSSEHTLSFKNNLHWCESHGQMNLIREHIDEKQVTSLYTENVTHFSERLVLLCAEPGMGKSTLMTRLAKNNKDSFPQFWVVAISLDDQTRLFAQGKHKDALAFLSEACGLEDGLQKSLFKFHLEVSGNVVVLLDGFDEIAPKYDDQCCHFLTVLRETKVKKIWISSRNSMKSKLEDHLSTFATKIRKFNEKDQRSFLKQFWTEESILSEQELDDFIELLLDKASRAFSDLNKDFLGVPLQMHIMAEVYSDNVKSSAGKSTLPDKLDLLQLMEEFVEKKLRVYVDDKLKMDSSNVRYDSQLNTNRKEFLKNHSKAALVLILREEEIKELHSKSILKKAMKFFKEISSCHDNTGIIDSIVNDKPRFIHRVFAEYFVAKWFAEHLSENASFLQSHLYQTDFFVVRTIFELEISKDCKLHTAVLNEDLEGVRTLLEGGADVDDRDPAGRTALHLAAAFGPSEDKETNRRRCEILDLLINRTKNFNLEDEIHHASPLRYADMTRSWIAINKLLPNYSTADAKRDLTETSKHVTNKDMLYQIATHDLEKLQTFCSSEGLTVDLMAADARQLRLTLAQNGSSLVAAILANVQPTVDDFPLHHAASRGNLQAVTSILRQAEASSPSRHTEESVRTTPSTLINQQDKFGWTALHHAVFHGHTAVADLLVRQGADLESRERMLGSTPLHMAAGLGRPGVATCLLNAVHGTERYRYLRVGNDHGRTALHLAVETNHMEVVRILVDAAEDVSPGLNCNQNQESACTVASAIDASAGTSDKADYVNVRDNSGRTALHDAAWHANAPALSYLIGQGGNVYSVEGNNSTPLHWAAGCGDAKTVRVLLEAVDQAGRAAYVDMRETDGNTALHNACLEGRWESARNIVDAGGRASVVNRAGETPLMGAGGRGHREVVAVLLDGFDAGREGMSVKDYIYMRDKDGFTVLDLVDAEVLECVIRYLPQVSDFDVD